MKPLNSAERLNAILKFLGVYLLILVIPLLAFYLLLYIPDKSLAAENYSLKASLDEQKKLVTTLDTMGGQLKKIQQIDGVLIKEQDEFAQAQNLRILKEYENDIQSLVFAAKRDSSEFKDLDNKKMAKGIISSLDAFLTYRNTIGLLRQTIKEKGISSDEIEKLNANLKETENQLETCKLMLAMKPKDSGGGGGGGGSAKEIEKLQAQLRECDNKLKASLQNATKGSMPAVTVDASKFEEKIAELEARLTMAKAGCDESKAESRIVNCNQRKSLYQSALAIYTKLAASEVDIIKKEAQKKVTEVTAKIKKPPVGCE